MTTYWQSPLYTRPATPQIEQLVADCEQRGVYLLVGARTLVPGHVVVACTPLPQRAGEVPAALVLAVPHVERVHVAVSWVATLRYVPGDGHRWSAQEGSYTYRPETLADALTGYVARGGVL